ncbi:MAG TPA: sugar phosphate nucleotidyltransferase [Chloroflexota bacterium]|nr:sugar phosphate nucleotidyltransferase [Chloroflexota bacterium]
MRAVVLAGGQGRRLLPYTVSFPKPLVPLGDMPIIEIVLRQLRWYGIESVVISVGHLAELIEAYFLAKGGVPGLDIRYVREREPLGTAGALGLLDDLGDDEDLVVVNGDILTTLNLAELMAFHERERPALTLASRVRQLQIDLGVLEVKGDGTVVGYTEKPELNYRCSMGINVYSRHALTAIRRNERLDFPDLVLRLLAQGERVLCYETDCYWLDIGRREDYERANAEFEQMRPQLLPDEAGTASD